MGHAFAKFIPSGQKYLQEFSRFFPLDSCSRAQRRLPEVESTGLLPERFLSAGPALPGTAAPPCAASNPAAGPFRSACTPAVRSLRSACPRIRPVGPDRSLRHERKSPHPQKSPRDKKSPGSEKTPSPTATAVAPPPPTAADTVSASQEFARGTAIGRDHALNPRPPDLAFSGSPVPRSTRNGGHAAPPFPARPARSLGCDLASILWFPGRRGRLVTLRGEGKSSISRSHGAQ